MVFCPPFLSARTGAGRKRIRPTSIRRFILTITIADTDHGGVAKVWGASLRGPGPWRLGTW